jgi:hypothetical protein
MPHPLPTPNVLTGDELRQLFRRHRKTIRQFSTAAGIPQTRIRLAFARGLADPNAIRDWLEILEAPAKKD